MGIKISDLPKAQVLAALYNASVPTGASILHYRHGFLTTAEAEQLLHQDPDLQERVDYLRGRRVKLDFTPPAWDPLPYEQTTGTGTASKVLEILRHTKQPDHPEIQHLHYQLLKKQRDQEGWTLAKLVSLQLPEVLKGLEAADRAT